MPLVKLALWVLLVSSFAALNLYSRETGARPPDDLVYRYEFGIGGIASYALLFSLLLALTIGLPRRRVLALRPPASWGRALALALGGLVAIFAGATATLALAGAGDEQNLAPEGWDGSRAGAYALSFVAVVFVGPVTEELLYRGLGLTLLLERFGPAVAVAVTSVLFGIGHGLVLSLAAFVWFGVVIALVRLRTDSIYPTFVVHSLFNASGMVVPLLV